MKDYCSEEFLLFLFNNSERIFKKLKSEKYFFMEKFKSAKTDNDVIGLLYFDFYDFFKNKNLEYNYFMFYYLYQSFFLDPENYFLYDEDFIQSLATNSFYSFKSYYDKYYSYESLVSKKELIDYEYFILKNLSRAMTLEFKNLKRVMLTEIKKPCSFYSDSSFSIDKIFEDFSSNNDYLEEKEIDFNQVKILWKKNF